MFGKLTWTFRSREEKIIDRLASTNRSIGIRGQDRTKISGSWGGGVGGKGTRLREFSGDYLARTGSPRGEEGGVRRNYVAP